MSMGWTHLVGKGNEKETDGYPYKSVHEAYWALRNRMKKG